jgi:phosphatidylglycerol:prolipoprotein diacylglycerol transferase
VRSTLFYIPHADPFLHIPFFGLGWCLALLACVGLVVVGLRIRKHGWKAEVLADLPMFLILGAAIYWVVPLVEERTSAGVWLGIPIRAYGTMLLLGIIFALWLLVHQGRQMGLHGDLMFSLAFWMVLCGFVGARLFYVIEYWRQFSEPSWTGTLRNIAKLTDGGLVVYGSFVGAAIAAYVFLRRHRLPLLAIADLVGPSMMLGVAFGRIGCLMNGCCWGGLCYDSSLGITFPQGSPPYVDQLKKGTLLGMHTELQPDGTYLIRQVDAGGRADRSGLKAGDRIEQFVLPSDEAFNRMRHGENVQSAQLVLQLTDGRRVEWEFGELPQRSAAVYPTQILSSINAALICLFLWAYYPFRKRDGEVTALLVSIYPVTRILLEMIRTDESSLLKTSFKLTISQAVSGLLLLAVLALWWYVLSRPAGSALPRKPDHKAASAA